MRIRGSGRVRRWVRRVAAPFRSEAAILMYHRVVEASSAWRSYPSPRQLGEHLESLCRDYRVVRLRELAAMLPAGQVPRRTVVLTFDDGTVDSIWHVKPLLERHDVPATVSVATGYLDSDREFWWDELERLVFLTLAGRLRLSLRGKMLEWQLNQPDGPLPVPLSGPRWNVFSDRDPTPRHRAYRELYWLLRPMGREDQEAALEVLRAQTGENGRARPGYRVMTSAEVHELADGGLVEIGAHTVTHPMLAAQPPDAQRWEMVESKRILESILARPVESFCYPYGGKADVGETTVDLAREVGFKAACASVPGLVTRRANLYWLPRLYIGAWDGDEFARRLRAFLV